MFKFRSTIELLLRNIVNMYQLGANKALRSIVDASFTGKYSRFLESTTKYSNVT